MRDDRRTEAAGVSPLETGRFKDLFRGHPAGVAVVGLRGPDGALVGLTVTSVISVSAEPPILAFSIASTSSSWPAVQAARTLAVSFLADDQHELAARFARHGIDRFADGGWRLLPTGEPVVEGAVAWIQGEVVQRAPVGSSYLVAVLAQQASDRGDRHPLVYRDRTYHRLRERREP
ncbi:MAG: flavin oxidoreductase [Cellulomonas sp. 73-145]|nr:flavin reductase family protein [Cellulomonas sp.]OJV59617.1 MAG: flavin oxidoreductase [Cellulomonas sp. 73-145]